MSVKKNLMLWLAVFALALPLLLVGTASAKYMSDGAVHERTTGGWITPNDMMCIVGVHTDGTLDIADGVTNARDCIYLQTGTMNGGTAFDLTAMTTSAACTDRRRRRKRWRKAFLGNHLLHQIPEGSGQDPENV